MNRRPVGLAVAAAGFVIGVIGLVGSAVDDESSNAPETTPAPVASTPARPASTAPATTLAPTTAPVETPAPPTTATPSQVEAPEEFFAAFGAALRTGDEEFLLRRIHPEVERRYGRPACEAYIAGVSDPEFAGEIESSAAAPDWVWETDGRATPIPDAIMVLLIRRTGEPAAEVHLAVVDDELRWFTDCGEATG